MWTTFLSLDELLTMEIPTAGKKPQKIQDIPASVMVTTIADIEHYGWQTAQRHPERCARHLV